MPGEPGGSCIPETIRFGLRATGGTVNAVREPESTEPVAWSMAAAELGGSGVSDCILQQSPHCIITGALQSCIDIPWQQEECSDGLRQARTGAAAQRTTTASNTKTPFLLTCIVYAIRYDPSDHLTEICAVTRITPIEHGFLHNQLIRHERCRLFPYPDVSATQFAGVPVTKLRGLVCCRIVGFFGVRG